MLYCKGADSVIQDRMCPHSKYVYKDMFVIALCSDHIDDVKEHVDNYANQGLRTLLLAKKVIPPDTFKQWSEKYNVFDNIFHRVNNGY